MQKKIKDDIIHGGHLKDDLLLCVCVCMYVGGIVSPPPKMQ